MTTAVRPVRQGLDGAFLADASLDAMIDGRVWADSSKPEHATTPFIAIGTPFEGDFNVFNGPGNDGTRIVHLYADDEDVVEVMYGHVKRICAAGITVTGHTLLRLTCSLMSVSNDPGGGAHGVVRVAALTKGAA